MSLPGEAAEREKVAPKGGDLPAGRKVRRLALAVAVCCGLLTLAPPAEAAFPGGNGRIVFSSNRDGDYDLYSMDADGSNVSQVTNNPGDDRSPAWSPNGLRIAFQNNMGGDYEVYTIDSTIGLFQVTSNTVDDLEPTWSYDGRQIAFSRPFGGGNAIFRANADGTAPALVYSTNLGRYRRPSWSNLDEIAFDSSSEDGYGVVVTRPDGTFERGIHTPTSDQRAPNWSPSAAKLALAFASPSTANGTPTATGIRTVSAQGTGPFDADVQAYPVVDDNPAWTPDATKILFDQHTAPSGTAEIWSVNVDGSADLQLTNNPADDVEPDQKPLVDALLRGSYPRPIGAAKSRFVLVPAFKRCSPADSNTSHGPPLTNGSCAPAQEEGTTPTRSQLVRWPNDDSTQGNGFIVIRLVPGDLATPADEADVSLIATINDVRCTPLDPIDPPLPWAVNPPPCGGSNSSGGLDYTGRLLITSTLRITDSFSGYGPVPATLPDIRFDAPIQCAANGDPAIGGSCNLATTVEALYADDRVKENKRTLWEIGQIEVMDPGPDNYIDPSCPSTCGNGDEAPFLRSGVFIP